ncbi:family 16 glycosylhydrolase [Cohnella sp. CFH 77786]|uniref:carbohydrate binding domain-containing protein n=1 Tax=Cohnella sp. CFH 77786 TaxID=2662265 RepID=UPI001C608DE7|nr:carbohydrate binding domain-containing protein [Cohnella sp. CFH 77786]MBW5445051.1 family 16 glycosylhydrolase [Cohnella sp. CFH 77786]
MRFIRYRSSCAALLASIMTFSLFAGSVSASTKEAPAPAAKDVTAAHWAAGAIYRWQQAGVIRGYPDGTFRPSTGISRAEFASLMNRTFGLPAVENASSYPDVKPGSWAQTEIATAIAAGYLKLDAHGLAQPNAKVSRADAANALNDLFRFDVPQTADAAKFSDIGSLDAGTRDSIAALASRGYLKGFEDGTYRPNQPITRAEIAALLDRLIGLLVNKAGTATSATPVGNVVVTAPGAAIKDALIEGNLYVTPGVGDGDADFTNVTVKGTAFVEGGGENTVTFADSKLTRMNIDKPDDKVRVLVTGNSGVSEAKVQSGAIVEGSFDRVTVVPDASGNGPATVIVRGTVDELTLDSRVRLVLEEGAVVKHLTATPNAGQSSIEGTGKVEKIDNKADGLRHNGKPVPVAITPIPPATGGNGGTPTTPSDPWTLVWSDEFNDGTIDPAKWTYDTTNGASVGNPGWGNNELQYYTNRPENVKEQEGKLLITARKEPQKYEGFDYTSARIKTKGLFAKKYGKFEIRAKAPTGKGLWPAIWMLPENNVYGTWAASGEIDIMEGWGSRPHDIAGTIHFGRQWPGNTYSGKEYTFANSTTHDFHTYSIEWEPGEIRWYVDGLLYSTKNDWYSKGDGNPANFAYPAPFDQEFHLIMNLAVGGNFDGNPTPETPFPSTLEIDYVRVYELTGRPYRDPVPVAIPRENYLPGANLPQGIDKDLVYNADYTENIEGDAGMGIPGTAHWELFNGEGGAGNVTIDTIDDTRYAKVNISSGGSQLYSVQPKAIVSLAKGRYYKLSFQAKSDSARSMNVKVTGGSARGFSAYSPSLDASLTGDFQTYEMSFQMKQDSDNAARIEFNVGTNTKPVWIGKVKLVEIEGIAFDHDLPKTPLGDGNHIYNGTFDLGDPYSLQKADRLVYWHLLASGGAAANASVDPAARKLKVSVTNGGSDSGQIRLVQNGIQLIQNQRYRLTFEGSATPAKPVEAVLLSQDGTQVYASESVNLTAAGSESVVSFTMNGATTNAARLVLKLGGSSGEIQLDNIKMVRTSAYLDPSVVKFPLQNGQFDAGMAPWQTIGMDGATVASSVYQSEARLTIGSVGINPWSVMLLQDGLTVSGGVQYAVEFDARSTVNRTMEVILENSAYQRSFDQTVDLTPGNQRYRFEFTKAGNETVSLKFLLGNVPGGAPSVTHAVYIDNVVVEPKLSVMLDNKLPNGAFDTGVSGWTSFFADFQGVSGTLAAANGEMKAALSGSGPEFWSAQIDWENIAVEQGKSYRLTFDARSSVNRDIQVTVEHKGGDYAKYLDLRPLSLTGGMKTYSYTFTAGATDSGAHVNFLLGAINGQTISEAHDVYFDNISLVEVTLPPAEGHALRNGTFDSDTSGWSLGTADGSNAAISVDEQRLKVHFPNYDGWFQWSTIVNQNGLLLETGKTYRFSFEASSTLAKPVLVEIKRGDSGFHLTTQTVNLSTVPQTFSWDFTVTGATDPNALLQFLLGSNNVPGENFTSHSIFIDNVSLTELPS